MSSASASRRQLGRSISAKTASQLLDFRGKTMSKSAAQEQLRGAVAIHNLLQSEGVAYLADEVGMGKTYVALGAAALLRHFEPDFRMLVLAPRENIQKKWIKEAHNFANRNVKFSDLRTRSLQGTPARGCVACTDLIELVRETTSDPDRDFFARLTSFSLALGSSVEHLKVKRQQLLDLVPWLPEEAFHLRRDAFKDNFARAMNASLPIFDLVIVDEGHNLKHGFSPDATSGSSRNRVLSIAFGQTTDTVGDADFPVAKPRAKRVLFLSATPVEGDYEQLWNQLNVFGVAGPFATLRDKKASDDDKRECAKRFLVRRVTKLIINRQERTKNQYRLEWRKGGVTEHDLPLGVPDQDQRLVVALVQKKVSEVLGQAKFNNSFQIGMLASFESFLQTAKVARADDDEAIATFDDAEQTEDLDERLGIDVGEVNQLAYSFRSRFERELPHPKMDALVERLSSSFHTGEKALVFVRRVASVTELKRKLDERYNDYLIERLKSELSPALRPDFERVARTFAQERADALRRRAAAINPAPPDDEHSLGEKTAADRGDPNSFFGWFFRGDGPPDVLSGAALAKRFNQAGAFLSTFFEDNYIAWILGITPGHVTKALADYLGLSATRLASRLEEAARHYLKREKKQPRRDVFFAFQRAALHLLATHTGRHQSVAQMVSEERFSRTGLPTSHASTPERIGSWLEEATFITALREHPDLRQALLPEPEDGSERERFRERELRRELLSAMARLGHPFIDLYVLSINRIGRLTLRARELDETGGTLIGDFVSLLEEQSKRPEQNSAFHELSQAAAHFDLLISVNDPGLRSLACELAAAKLGGLLRAQQPVGGMSGQVNETLVRQFRMPGYPYILVTTDLLQEGEDLHTFCSSVYHYGISWMPSSMEQRVGRVDRVSSQSERRLSAKTCEPEDHELLQVFYPHLSDSVEALQVNRVLERMTRFMVLMHQDLLTGDLRENKVNVAQEFLRSQREIPRFTEPLRTAFPGEEHMTGPDRELAVRPAVAAALLKRFAALGRLKAARIAFEDHGTDGTLFGSIQLSTRTQPFTLFVRSIGGQVSVRCVSPIGQIEGPADHEVCRTAVEGTGVRLAVFEDDRFKSYNVTIEGDVMLGAPSSDAARVEWLLHRVTQVADKLEEQILGVDQNMDVFRDALKQEAAYER